MSKYSDEYFKSFEQDATPAEGISSHASDYFSQFESGPKEEDDRLEITKGISSGIDLTQGLGYGLAALAGDATGWDPLRKWGIEGYEENVAEAQANAPRVQRIEDIHGANDFADWAMGSIGQLAPTVASVIATGGVGGVLARQVAKKSIANYLKKNVGKEVSKKAMSRILQRAAAKGQMQGAAVGAMGMETGEIYGDVAAEGFEGAKAIASSIAGGVAAGALDVLPVMRVAKQLGFGGGLSKALQAKYAQMGIGKRIGSMAASQAGFEGITEALQTVIEEATKSFITDHDLPEDLASMMMNAAAAGAIGGTVMGGVGGIPSVPERKPISLDEIEDATLNTGSLDETLANASAIVDAPVDIAAPTMEQVDVAPLSQEVPLDVADYQLEEDRLKGEQYFKEQQRKDKVRAIAEEVRVRTPRVRAIIEKRKAAQQADVDRGAPKLESAMQAAFRKPLPDMMQAEQEVYPAESKTDRAEQEADYKLAHKTARETKLSELQKEYKELNEADKKVESAEVKAKILAEKTAIREETQLEKKEKAGDLFEVIKRKGGITKTEAATEGLDPADTNYSKGVFTKEGDSVDGMLEAVNQEGFTFKDKNDLLNAVNTRLRGEAVRTPEAYAASVELQVRQREYELKQQEESDVQARKDQIESDRAIEQRAKAAQKPVEIKPAPVEKPAKAVAKPEVEPAGVAGEVKEYPIADRGEWYGDSDYKARGGRIVEISPDAFLDQVKPLTIDEESRENIDILKDHINSGKTLDPLAIYENGEEDGRHRAIAAKELGMGAIPVIDFRKAEEPKPAQEKSTEIKEAVEKPKTKPQQRREELKAKSDKRRADREAAETKKKAEAEAVFAKRQTDAEIRKANKDIRVKIDIGTFSANSAEVTETVLGKYDKNGKRLEMGLVERIKKLNEVIACLGKK